MIIINEYGYDGDDKEDEDRLLEALLMVYIYTNFCLQSLYMCVYIIPIMY